MGEKRKRTDRSRDRGRKKKSKDSTNGPPIGNSESENSNADRDRDRKKRRKDRDRDRDRADKKEKNSRTRQITSTTWAHPGFRSGADTMSFSSLVSNGLRAGIDPAIGLARPVGAGGVVTHGPAGVVLSDPGPNGVGVTMGLGGTTTYGGSSASGSGTGPGNPNGANGEKKLANYIASCYMHRPTLTDDEKKERLLLVGGLQQGQTAVQLLQYVNVFVLTVTQQTVNQQNAILGPATAQFKPAFDCEIDYSGERAVAEVWFRSFEGTQVALNLHELEFDGSVLHVSRPASFGTSKRYQAALEDLNEKRKQQNSTALTTNPPSQELPPLTELPPDHFKLSSADLQRQNLSLYDLFGIPDPSKVSQARIDAHLKKNTGKLSFLDCPLYLEEAHLRELFSQFGSLRYFELMLYPDGTSKGYGMLEYDNDVLGGREVDLEFVLDCLNGMVLGEKALKVQRLVVGTAAGSTVVRSHLGVDTGMRAIGDLRRPDVKSISSRVYSNPLVAKKIDEGLKAGRVPSRVVQLVNVVFESDLLNDAEAEDVRKHVFQEATKYGSVETIRIPRPSSFAGLGGSHDDGVGKIFVHFREIISARKFQAQVNGRRFDGRTVCAAFYPVDRFTRGLFTLEDKGI